RLGRVPRRPSRGRGISRGGGEPGRYTVCGRIRLGFVREIRDADHSMKNVVPIPRDQGAYRMNKESFIVMGGGLLREALGAWRAGNRAFSVLYAGIACEHMLKAVLCHHDPVLISDKGDMAHRFHALGFGEADGAKPLKQAKTIGMAEAFRSAEIV